MNFHTVTMPLISVNIDQNIHLWAGKTFIVTFVHTKIKRVVLVVVVLAFFGKKKNNIKVLLSSYLQSSISDLRCLETFSS